MEKRCSQNDEKRARIQLFGRFLGHFRQPFRDEHGAPVLCLFLAAEPIKVQLSCGAEQIFEDVSSWYISWEE